MKFDFYFSIIVSQICLYGLKIVRNIEVKHLFHFKTLFHVLDIFQTSRRSNFKFYLLVKVKISNMSIKFKTSSVIILVVLT